MSQLHTTHPVVQAELMQGCLSVQLVNINLFRCIPVDQANNEQEHTEAGRTNGFGSKPGL